MRQAIYDGPFDWVNFAFTPVILQNRPTPADGSASLAPLTVQPGDPVVDVNGKIIDCFPEGAVCEP